MKIVILGANGQTGSHLVREAISRGHEVVAAVRRPETMEGVAKVRVAKIDLGDVDSLCEAFHGADSVVFALGHGGLKASAQATTLYSSGIRAVREAMERQGIRRLHVLSSGGVEEDAASPWFYRKLLRPYLANTYIDMARMETILEESPQLDWTAVRLTYLLDGPAGNYEAREGRIEGGNFKIHMVDAARFILDDIASGRWINKHPVLGYPKQFVARQLPETASA